MASLFTATVIIITLTVTAARDLRPSNHGLIFQNSSLTPANPPMKSFFNSSHTTTSSDSDMPFPNSASSTESLPPAWRRAGGGGGRHWGRVLIVASLVCGVTGVTLLVATGILYLFIRNKRKRRNNPTLNESFRDADNDFNANQL
ncbi:hypothetical protein RIF29_41004 [Crotalaria pallida]|uniref:Uncharacterized protein n=1 Tax=Crotalaria pallida TaxID=3830 RepID=A0AAN9E4J6_CROPI